MKLFSQYLKNIMINFPIGHKLHQLASSQLLEVLRFERDGDGPSLAATIESWGLDPLDFDVVF